jgi:hypothetical protein
MLLIGLAFAAGVAFADVESNPSPPAAPAATASWSDYEPAERYRFALGGDSGQYTDAERDGLEHFDGLGTSIHIDGIKGKPDDKWAASARINLYGPGEGSDRKFVSLIFLVDRKTHHISPEYQRGKDTPRSVLQKDLSTDKAIDLVIIAASPGKLRIGIDGDAFDVDCDLDIKGFSLMGSGMDVRFEPFALLHRKS